MSLYSSVGCTVEKRVLYTVAVVAVVAAVAVAAVALVAVALVAVIVVSLVAVIELVMIYRCNLIQYCAVDALPTRFVEAEIYRRYSCIYIQSYPGDLSSTLNEQRELACIILGYC